MDIIGKNEEQEPEQEQIRNEELDNNDNEKKVDEAGDNFGLNYEGEYDGEMEGEEGHMEEEREEEGQEEGMDDGHEEQINKGREEFDERQDHQREKLKVEGEEQFYEEPNNDNNIDGHYINNSTKKNAKEKEIESPDKNYKYINNDDKNSNNKKDLTNLKRLELINNKLNLNNKKAEKLNNENIIDKEIEKDNEDSHNFKNFPFSQKNDVLSELMGRIKNFKEKKNDKNKQNSNYNLDELDKELTKGLEKLNNISSEINLNEEQKVNSPQYERKVLRNPKFKEILSMMNENDFKRNKNYKYIGKNELLSFMNKNKYKGSDNFSNISLFTPTTNSNISGASRINSFGNNLKKFRTDSNKYYVSCIDGKAIINGIRKDVPFIAKFNYNDEKYINKDMFGDLYKTYNAGKTIRKNNDFKIKEYLKKNEFDFEGNKTQKNYSSNYDKNDFNFNKLRNNFSKENLTNKLNKIDDDNYFKRELKYFN